MMDWYFYISLCIFSVSQSVAFNIDPASWKTFTGPSQSQNVAFGYKVIQKDASRLVVSDPLIQINQQKRGQIYNCDVTSRSCSPLTIGVPSEGVNMSLGLSMVMDPRSSKLVTCGPTIPKKCPTFTTYNGMCFIEENDRFARTILNTLRVCPGQIDIAFLLDGSGSVGDHSFEIMKDFVINVIRRFTQRDAQFAIAQYSKICAVHFFFNELNIQDRRWDSNVKNIQYQNGPSTYTATAIGALVNGVFITSRGMRPSAKQILVVITDGQSHDRKLLDQVTSQADAKSIVRFAIGVGDAFNSFDAKAELNKIASGTNHVFEVTDFNALNNILQTLEENIIAIEGTQTSGDSSRMEFAQDGFSTAFTPYGSVLVSAVGAFQWKGGYQEYFPEGSFQTGSAHESYQGYSMAVATVVSGISFAILGAPRHQHRGQVTISRITTKEVQTLDSPTAQIGSYFGAEVCVVDLESKSNTDLLLVSAPTYTESEREGRVFVYSYTRRPFFSYFGVVLVGMAGQRGRFGSSLASPADLNGDGFKDVLVGAPLEENGQGSIYIFNGRFGGIISSYSQRIAGSSVQSELKYFGVSLSQSSPDQTKDSLPDIAVGSKGAVVLLRSRPIMSLKTKVTFNPSKISTAVTTDCLPMENRLTVCFTMRRNRHFLTGLKAKVTYNITLDANRLKYRAEFSPKNRLISDVMSIKDVETEECKNHAFLIAACPEDALNPLSNQLKFTFEGLPSNQNLEPILLPETETTSDHDLDFERECGKDNVCIDELRIDFNFSGSTNIEVGIMQEINVTVFVENRGENSYNPHFTLKYPYGFSYRRTTLKQGRVECSSSRQ